ncbi:MAG: alpha/beta hydrolase-fold protein [Algibacter sp.]|uniref:alpha/beta hydrolase-fold protein n=1 Tax=Algibacter sp. TaxID=1872428 RepID=UPI0032970EA4
MKNQFFIILFLFIGIACGNSKKQEDNPLLSEEEVTFIIEKLPVTHQFNDDIYISGDFEGWSGGKEQFKLKKVNKLYAITIPKYQENISFKFTKGHWETVECKDNGNPIENRSYRFSKLKDTVKISITNWTTNKLQNKVSTATENVQVFAENFEIPQLNRKRKISIYLPPNYNTSQEKFPVLYIQDGQNVFDVASSYSGEWQVDETLNSMYKESGFGLIVVAIDHGGEKRLNEYSAWDNENSGKGEGKLYLDFLVNTLKPKIDNAFRTKSDSQNTAVMGSSLGGLFAHYAAIVRPDVFGKAGVFSPSFWYAKDSFEFTKERSNIDASKIYYVVGEKEGNNMVKPMKEMVTLMRQNGFPEHQLFSVVVPAGTHSESFWKSEFQRAIGWLFNISKQ